MASPPPSAGESERITLCAGRYELFPGRPLPDFASPGSRACAAQGLRGSTGVLALIAEPGEFPRFDLTPQAAGLNSPGVLRYLEGDVIYWADFGRHVPVLLYERPPGPRLLPNLTDDRTPISNEIHFRQMVESLTQALSDLYLGGVNHGRINPTNIFLRDASSYAVLLGEYLSTQPGKHQHPAFCTIERGMCHPCGRGPAAASDDIYAMGVTLLTMIFGKLPAMGLDAASIVRAKIEKGSLMALSGGLRIPSAYSEILRGLLADDPTQRWALDDINHWLGGRRMGSKPAGQLPKAQRGFELAGQTYTNVRLLAQAMTVQVDPAARTLEDGSLDRWLRRSLGDEARVEKVAEAVASAGASQRGGSPAERAVTRVAISLDPPAPIRFRDISVLPGGLGPALAESYAKGQSPRNVADLISAQFIIHWANSQANYATEGPSLVQSFEGLRVLLDRPQHGFGIERVLYELNPGLPCLSPLVAGAYPLSLKAMMQALEAHAATIGENDSQSEPMDRHIAAYILARHRRINDRLFPLLAANTDSGQRAVAILSVLADIQRKFNPEPMPRTAEWLDRLLQPSMERFRNLRLREKVIRDIRKVSRRGELDQMLSIIDDGNTQRQDSDGFTAARNEWLQLERMARDLSSNSGGRDRALLQQGRQITAFVGALAAMITAVIVVFVKLV